MKEYRLTMTDEEHKQIKIKSVRLGKDMKTLFIEGAKQYKDETIIKKEEI